MTIWERSVDVLSSKMKSKKHNWLPNATVSKCKGYQKQRLLNTTLPKRNGKNEPSVHCPFNVHCAFVYNNICVEWKWNGNFSMTATVNVVRNHKSHELPRGNRMCM